MNIGWPEGIWIALAVLQMVLVLLLHGENRTDKWNFHSVAWSNACIFGLLYWGGFFA